MGLLRSVLRVRMHCLFVGVAVIGVECVAAAQPRPVALTVQPSSRSFSKNDAAFATIRIVDAQKRPVKATALTPLEVECRVKDRTIWKKTINVNAGDDSARFYLPKSTPGIMQIRVQTPGLHEAGTAVKLNSRPESNKIGGAAGSERSNQIASADSSTGTLDISPPSGGRIPAAAMRARAGAAPSGPGASSTGGQLGGSHRFALNPEARVRSNPGGTHDVSTDLGQPGGAGAASPGAGGSQGAAVPIATPTENAQPIKIEIQPDSGLYPPDGVTGLPIQAYVANDSAVVKTPVKIMLSADHGKFDAKSFPLTIPANEDFGATSITSDRPGTTSIQYRSMDPRTGQVTPREFKVEFDWPVENVQVVPDPKVTLFDRAQVRVILRDMAGHAARAHEDRRVSLIKKEGAGDFSPSEVTIKKGASEASTTFWPSGLGDVSISATSTDLKDADPAKITVTTPTYAIGLLVVGSLLGGLLAFKVKPDKLNLWWRLVLGLVSGVLFYWACIYLGVAKVLPRGAILNPFGALALGVVGGWLGSEVFAIVLKPLGLGKSDKPEGGAGP